MRTNVVGSCPLLSYAKEGFYQQTRLDFYMFCSLQRMLLAWAVDGWIGKSVNKRTFSSVCSVFSE